MKKTILRNGMTLIMDKRPSKSIAIVLTVKVGSVNENEKNVGISHFVEHMLFNGTKNRSREQIWSEIAELGGKITGGCGKIRTYYWTKVLNKHFDKALSIIADMVQNPLFEEKSIQKEKEVIIKETGLASPYNRLCRLFEKTLFNKSPVKNPIFGTKRSVRAMTREELVKYYRRHYIPNNMIICIVGNIAYEDTKGKVKKEFSNFEKGKLPKQKRIKEPTQTKPQKKIEKVKVSSPHIALGYKTTGAREGDSYVLDVIQSILTIRLDRKIRSEGLAYDIDVANVRSKYGLFMIYVNTGEGEENLIKNILLNEIKFSNLTAKEIKVAKNSDEGSYISHIEDYRKWAQELSFGEVVGNLKLGRDYIREIRKITKKDILRVIKKYFNKNYTLVILKPK